MRIALLRCGLNLIPNEQLSLTRLQSPRFAVISTPAFLTRLLDLMLPL